MRTWLMTCSLILSAPVVAWFAVSGAISWQKLSSLTLVLLPMLWSLLTVVDFGTADGDLVVTSKSAPPPGAFNDKVVWITGASQGFGEELARGFDRLGAKLILSSRRISELERVKANIKGKHVLLVPLDLTAGEAVLMEAVELADSAYDGHGVDIMVHNAAYPRPKLGVLDISENEARASFDVNVLGAIILTRLLAPKMVDKGRGHFVVMSSLAGKIPSPGQSIYSGTKFAMHGYFGALRNEIGYKGIKVTLICPGPISSTHNTHDPKERQPLGRVLDLTLKATYYELEETWITYQPLLSMVYLQQYCPSLASYIMQKMGPKRVQHGNTYSLAKLIK